MPASILGDRLDSAIRMSLAPSSQSKVVSNVVTEIESEENLDDLEDLVVTGANCIKSELKFDEKETYNTTSLDELKNKCIVVSVPKGKMPNCVTNGTSNGLNGQTNGSTTKKDSSLLPKPNRVLYSLKNVQLGWKQPGWNTGTGMINLGFTCFLNSILQALFHVPAFVNWLLSDVDHRQNCEDCLICSMATTLLQSQNRNQPAIRPHLITSKIRTIHSSFRIERHQQEQEDAHEFLRYLIEAMERSFVQRFFNEHLDPLSKETTPLNQILGGYLRSAVRCLHCGNVNTTVQHFQDLMLDIRKVNTIDDALQMYFSKERLDDQSYKCEACKQKVMAVKQFSIERAPFVLCVQLKRFSAFGGKIGKHISFRHKLDLTEYSNTKTTTSLIYKLVALVSHKGPSANYGHYTAVTMTPSGSYFEFDDNNVRPMSHQSVINNCNAYVMFYELEDNPLDHQEIDRIKCANKASNAIHINGNKAKLATLAKNELTVNGILDEKPASNGTANAFDKLESKSFQKVEVKENKFNKPTGSKLVTSGDKHTCVNSNTQQNGETKIKLTFFNRKLGHLTNEKNQTDSKCVKTFEVNSKKMIKENGQVSGSKVEKSPVKVNGHEKFNGVRVNKNNKTNESAAKVNGIKSECKEKEKTKCFSTNGANVKKLVPYDSDTSSEVDGEEEVGGKWTVSIVQPKPPTLSSNGDVNWSTKTSKTNGFAHESGKSSNNNVVNHLLSTSHNGYGQPVSTWSGQRSVIAREIDHERNETLTGKRSYSFDDEVDAGRTKKVRYNQPKFQNFNNDFQEYQNTVNNNHPRNRWTQNYNGNGFGNRNFYGNNGTFNRGNQPHRRLAFTNNNRKRFYR